MAEQEPNPGSAHDLVRVGLTLASLSVADAGLGPRHLVPLRRPEELDLRYEALVYLTRAMIALIVAVGVFLFTALER